MKLALAILAALAIAALAVIGWFLHKFSLSAIPDHEPQHWSSVAWLQARADFKRAEFERTADLREGAGW